MGFDVVDLAAVEGTQAAIVGGKGAHLGALARIDGVRVPPGFCVTTVAHRRAVLADPTVVEALDRLGALDPDDRAAGVAASAAARAAIEQVDLPDDLVASITEQVGRWGPQVAWAVRSSATAEDLPTASFAGQHDSWLNVVGATAVVEHVRRCWASLCTERAVAYRVRNGIDHRTVHMAVVVQQLVVPEVSGVVFTADPVSGDRKVATVEATFGLGEALVSGLVDADAYRVRGGEVVARTAAAEPGAVVAVPGGGTQRRAVGPDERRPTLTDAEAVELVALGRRIEAALGGPQDIEWCRAGGETWIVQSRPITTLFPIPAGAADGANHVYVSVGHQQMMTDPMKPLGLSVWQLRARPVMHEAAGRLFVEVTDALASPATRAGMLHALCTSDPLVGDALQTIVDRPGFLPEVVDGAPVPPPPPGAGPPSPIENDPAIVAELIERSEASLAAAAAALEGLAGPDVLAAIRADIEEQKQDVFAPRNLQAIMAGMEATWWLNDHLLEWLGERSVADTLSLSVPGNVTSEMGLALLDVADVVRRHPEAVALLEGAEDDDFLDRLPEVAGGAEARAAITAFLDAYGARCVGEIDLTRPRWSEHPQALVPTILADVRAFEPGEAARRVERGRAAAAAKEQEVLARLRELPDGEAKAAETASMIDRIRTFVGYREYPKFAMMRRSALYRRAVLVEAERLVADGVLRAVDDAWFLRFEELEEVVRTRRVDLGLVDERRAAFRAAERLTPPRVLTSDGEAVAATYRRDDVPAGALAGLAVSAGTVEGRARVVHDIAEARLEPGDILVTAFTDPSWSPLFVAVAGLVTEVGGLMTHGSVIAREYGLPAVVGVEGATRRIRDGQRIRVHGTDGFVELLP